jgi:UDP-glucose 4-epimerase
MRILVTGGAGYIGSVITEELCRDRHEVLVYDNLSKGHRGAVSADAEFIHADLMDSDTLRQALNEHGIEAVIHMAADSLVGESTHNPARYYRNNVAAGLNLLDEMLAAGVKRLVFSSTAAVYGEPAKQPIEETDATVPTNPYGETKLAFERALRWYESAYGLRYASLRYFNAAGATIRCGEAHAPETHLIPLILQAAAGKREYLEIYGDDYPTRDGTCVRDYIHVTDLARAHILALGILDEKSSIYNLGCGGSGYSVREVMTTAREVTGRDFIVRTSPRRTGDPGTLVASSEKIRRELGWKPEQQELRAIIASAWNWMQEHPNGYDSARAQEDGNLTTEGGHTGELSQPLV